MIVDSTRLQWYVFTHENTRITGYVACGGSMRQQAKFVARADAQGRIVHIQDLALLTTVRIESLTITTVNNCLARSHRLNMSISNNSEVINIFDDAIIVDCRKANAAIDRSFGSGVWRIHIDVDGFAPDENVDCACEVVLEYRMFEFVENSQSSNSIRVV